MRRRSVLTLGAVVLVTLLALSGVRPYDRGTWLLEVLPVILALPILGMTYRRFPLTSLLYALIFMHAVVLIIGGMYTYARVPFGYELARLFGLARNPYDKIGHFFQGFVPAIVAREVLIRSASVRRGKMLAFIVVCIALAISATYELIEWATALALGGGATDFLGTQGDPWDTQSDMFVALIGAACSLLLLSRVHDRQLATLVREQS